MSQSRWFGGWFGGWFAEWFGGGSEVPVPPVVISGGRSFDSEPARTTKKRKRPPIAEEARKQPEAEAPEQKPELVLACHSQQAPSRSSTTVDSERASVVLPPITRQKTGEIRLGRTIDTIGEYIPRQRPPQMHPSPRSATRPQRQEARRPRKAVRMHDDEEAIVKAIASLL
jgi:hypothetical protein